MVMIINVNSMWVRMVGWVLIVKGWAGCKRIWVVKAWACVFA